MENYCEESERAKNYKKSSLKKTVAVLGTFDSKGEEFTYLIEKIKESGVNVLSIDAGTKENSYKTDISNKEVARLGGGDIEDLGNSRRDALGTMSAGVSKVVKGLFEEGRIDGIISMGGSGGTVLAAAAMRVLPVGFPKVLVSTVASSSRIFDYVDTSDVFFINSIVDVSGLNSIIRKVYDEAAGAIAGAVKTADFSKESHERLRIAATMYGVTTPGVTTAKKYLEEIGYEIITFHAIGSGGRVMEKLIREGYFDGVLDMTQTEIGMYVYGDRATSAGPDRCSGAAEMGIPCISCLGAMDMCSLGSLPVEGKRLYYHNGKRPSHFRPTVEQSREAGKFLAEQLNKATRGQQVIIPRKGLSMTDVEGGGTYGPEEDEALFRSLKENLNNLHITLEEHDLNINDKEFALIVATRMDEIMKNHYRKG